MFFFIFSFSLFSFLSLDHIRGPRYIKNVSKCREDIHYKTQTGTCCEKCYSKAFRMGFEPASSRLLDQCSTTELQKLLDMTPMACWSVKSLVPRGWNHEWCEYVYFFNKEINFRQICGYLQSLYRLRNLSNPEPTVWGNHCWFSFGFFRFVEKKLASQNDVLFCLKFAMHYLPNQDILF